MISSQIRNPIPSKTKRSAGAAAFVTNCWSAVLTAQHESPAEEAAFEKLCRGYWQPIYKARQRVLHSHFYCCEPPRSDLPFHPAKSFDVTSNRNCCSTKVR